MDDDLKFKHPFTSIISGATGSGKSSFCIRFLQNLKSLCSEQYFDGGILGCYSKSTAVPTEQWTVLANNIRFNEGVPVNLKNKNGKPCLKILHDLLHDVYSKEVCNLLTKGSHHRNICHIDYPKPLSPRTIL
jgi:predicted NACHT family NTPase